MLANANNLQTSDGCSERFLCYEQNKGIHWQLRVFASLRMLAPCILGYKYCSDGTTMSIRCTVFMVHHSIHGTANSEHMLLMIDYGTCELAPDRQWQPLRACSWVFNATENCSEHLLLVLRWTYSILQLRAYAVKPVYCYPSMLRATYLIDWEHAWSYQN